uniref:Immunoglobulin V-set domain-containing protein n=1 Tax=Theropithecus gelada TaxID=9565 RepID=A0A8D2GIA8_THEGE
MASRVQLLSFLFLWISDARAETILAQSPAFVSATPGDKVTISRRAAQDIDDDMNWYQQEPGEAPKLIIKDATTLVSGIPPQFSGSGYGIDFTLTINSMKSEDTAYYFCQQRDNTPLTVMNPVTKTSKCSPGVASAAIENIQNVELGGPVVFIMLLHAHATHFLFVSVVSAAPMLCLTHLIWQRPGQPSSHCPAVPIISFPSRGKFTWPSPCFLPNSSFPPLRKTETMTKIYLA